MKRVSKIMFTILLAAVLTTAAAVQASALILYVGEFGYSIDGDAKEAVIERYIGESNEMIIPEYIYDYRIVGVHRDAFADPDAVTLCFDNTSDKYAVAVQNALHCVLLQTGDADLNEKVNIRDVTEIQRYLAELTYFSAPRLRNADVNADSNVTIADATVIQEYLAEMRPSLTEE